MRCKRASRSGGSRGSKALVALSLISLVRGCTPNTTSTEDMQKLLVDGGEGYQLTLCPLQRYELIAALRFEAPNQAITTEGQPVDDTRAVLVVAGNNVTTAIDGLRAGLDGCRLTHVEIDGNREDDYDYGVITGANIQMGGDNFGQVVQHVRTYNPRGWSCVHIAEGDFNCANATVQHNDIGPCGSDDWMKWADGISLSCPSSIVQNNTIVDATDGGIVVFGAPGSRISDNHISVKTRTMLGGINMVDMAPWFSYKDTIVERNVIEGGFATSASNADPTLGFHENSALIKIGIAIGPEVWFDDKYGDNKTTGATVRDNVFTGAFGFGIAIGGAEDLVVSNNSFVDNVVFIGTNAPNCSESTTTGPHPPTALLWEKERTKNVTIEAGASTAGNDFVFKTGRARGLQCYSPPPGDVWPLKDAKNKSGDSRVLDRKGFRRFRRFRPAYQREYV